MSRPEADAVLDASPVSESEAMSLTSRPYFAAIRFGRERIIGCSVLLPFLLTGCSYSYDLKAIVLDGRLAFILDPSSRRDANCVHRIAVSAENGEATAAGSDDDRHFFEHGASWEEETRVTDCRNRLPIRYGQPLQGEPFQRPVVAAKPLRIGLIYSVGTSSSGSGYGAGRFRIRRDRTVENLPLVDMTAGLEEAANGI